MLKALRRLLYVLAVVVLTAVTQVGGLVLVVSTLVVWAIVPNRKLSGARALPVHLFAFVGAYAVVSLVMVPIVAQSGGRVPLQCTATLETPYAARSPVLCLLNRHYVSPHLKSVVETLSRDVAAAHPGTITTYLDANFPLFDGFPMLPHLSHDDGDTIDLAYFYTDLSGRYRPGRTPSPIGYWAFEAPPADAENPCADRRKALTLRWDMRALQRFWAPLAVDEPRTAEMLRWLTEEGVEMGVSRVLIEPHMATRLGVASETIGFAGCHAARHDDHLHVAVEAR